MPSPPHAAAHAPRIAPDGGTPSRWWAAVARWRATAPAQAGAHGRWRRLWPVTLLMAVLAALGLAAVQATRHAAEQSAGAEEAQRALTLLSELRLSTAAAEAGLRAYALTANPAALEPLQQAGPQVQAQLDALRTLGAGQPEQYSRLLALAPLLTQRLEALARTADGRSRAAAPAAGGLPVAVAAWELSDENRRTGERVRDLLARIQQHAQAQLVAAREQRDSAAHRAGLLTLLSVLASAGAAAAAGLRQGRTAGRLDRHLRQHRSADDSQRRSAQTLERLIDSSLAPIALIDAEGRFVRVNPATLRLWGGPAEALIATPLVMHTLPEDQRKTERVLAQAASAPQTLQHRCRRAGGEPLHLAWSLQAAGDDAGTLIAVAADLSEAHALGQTVARQAQALDAAAVAHTGADTRAADAERRLKELLGSLGRCLKAPLAALEQQARSAQAGLSDAPGAQATPQAAATRPWAAVLERSLALQRLVDEVLDLGRMHAGQMPLKREAFDLWESVQGVAAPVRAAAERKGLMLQLELADDLGYGHGDTQRVEQALGAVLRDAVDVAAAGTLTLAARRLPDGRVRLDVTHPRPAGEARSLDDLLTPLHDADLPCTPERTAHLLGLAMARGLARCMGGELTAAWPAPGDCVLTLTLPADELPGR